MLKFFPTPYPDELLYSVLARYHIRSGNTSPKRTTEELFNSRTSAAIIDMPCNIDTLTSNMPALSRYSSENLIMNYTLFPFYTAFLPKEQAELVFNSMKSDYGGNIHTRAGIMASSIKCNTYLKFCPICNNEDMNDYGEYYWHRLHQIPGVKFCSKHYVCLQDSKVSTLRLNKHEFIAASEENCITRPNVIDASNGLYEKQILFIKEIEWLINNYSLIALEDNLQEKYISILAAKGFATVNGRVYQEEFQNEFNNFYGIDFLNDVQSNIDMNLEHNWLANIVRKHRKSFHPIRHILLIQFLCGSLYNFFKENQKYKPFGEGPWPCLNAASEHYKELVVRDLCVTHCSDTKLPVGTFKCSCGFSYSRRGPDKSISDVYKIGRIKEFGLVWEERLKELVEIKKLGLRETSRTLNVDPNTIKKYATKLKLKINWDIRSDKNITFEGSTKKVVEDCLVYDNSIYRNKWLQLINENADLSKTQLRKLDKATFIWLYRNDRKWLNNNSPIIDKKIKENICTIDWSQRDKQVRKQLKEAFNMIMSSKSKPVRITCGRLGKIIHKSALIEKHIDKMPLSKAFIIENTENEYEFHIRKIKWAMKLMRYNAEEFKEWKILRLAGIRSEYHETYKDVIAELIKSDEMILYKNISEK